VTQDFNCLGRRVRKQYSLFRDFAYAMLYTRTSSAIRPRTLQHIQEQFGKHGIQDDAGASEHANLPLNFIHYNEKPG
jgi:hypothetical protein